MIELLSFTALILLLIYWWDAVTVKELARRLGRHACERVQLQFLDDTVQLTKTRLRRNARGRLVLWREYRFEFTPNHFTRHPGQVVFLGRQMIRLCAELPEIIDI